MGGVRMDYLAFDTNVYIHMCLKRVTSVTRPCFKSVKSLLKENKIKLVVPQIVRIEFEKNIENEFEDSRSFLNGVIKSLDRVQLPLSIIRDDYKWDDADRKKKEAVENLKSIYEMYKQMDLNE